MESTFLIIMEQNYAMIFVVILIVLIQRFIFILQIMMVNLGKVEYLKDIQEE
jgi:hypothetical protein